MSKITMEVTASSDTSYAFGGARRYHISVGESAHKKTKRVGSAVFSQYRNGRGDIIPNSEGKEAWYVCLDPDVSVDDPLYTTYDATEGPFEDGVDAQLYVQHKIDERIQGMVFDSLCAEIDKGLSKK